MEKLTCNGKHKVKVGNHLHTNMISKPEIMRNTSEKIQQTFMIKTLEKVSMEGTYLNIIKAYMKNPQQTSYSMVKN